MGISKIVDVARGGEAVGVPTAPERSAATVRELPVTVGFFLLSTDEARLLGAALAAAHAEAPDDLLVVDNASTDGTAELAEALGARVLRLGRRVSYCVAMNAGIAEVRGDAVALLQADTFVGPGYKDAALAALAEPGVGSVAPKLVRTLGPAPEERLGLLDTAGMVVDRRRKNSLVGHGAPVVSYARAQDVFGADGAAAVYRRETLEDCALGDEVFDPDLVRWASDADLAWRARTLGWRCVYAPESVVFHVRHYSPSTRAQMSEADRRMQFRNRYLMALKNDTPTELLRDLPVVATYELLALGHVALRERHLGLAYRQAARLAPNALRRRRRLAPRRRARTPYGLRAAP